MFGFRKKSPPLTAFCQKLTEQSMEHAIHAAPIADIDNRGKMLAMLIMYGAGSFAKSLHWEESIWSNSKRFLAGTNMDLITAEAIIWTAYIVGGIWSKDKDRKMMQRVGFATTGVSTQILQTAIKLKTGCDFSQDAISRRRFYREQAEQGSDLVSAFVSVILSRVGCKTFDESGSFSELTLRLEVTPITSIAASYFIHMPDSLYEMLKNMISDDPYAFPEDDLGT
jgi:hypothetical protein